MEANGIPEFVQKRIKVAKLFYPLERKLQRRLAKTLSLGFEETVSKLGEIAAEMDYSQSTKNSKFILWRDNKTSIFDCMFCLIDDITNLESVTEIFAKIKLYSPIFTYAFVRQEKDGDGLFDIFRFSKFSYLEHVNRVKYP